jgi:3-methyladenine DNA glycosylase AlkD
MLEEALDYLRRNATEDRREVAGWYFPTRMVVLGSSAEHMRHAAGALFSRLREEEPELVLETARALVDTDTMEGSHVAYYLLEQRDDAISLLKVRSLEAFGKHLDNWGTVDGFATGVAGRAWRLGVIADRTVHKWAKSKDLWWRRTALASTVALNLASRGGTGDPERTLAVCEMLAEDHEEMVVKALSWALRSVIARDEQGVRDFLDRHEAVLAKRVLREVRKKLDTGRKGG